MEGQEPLKGWHFYIDNDTAGQEQKQAIAIEGQEPLRGWHFYPDSQDRSPDNNEHPLKHSEAEDAPASEDVYDTDTEVCKCKIGEH